MRTSLFGIMLSCFRWPVNEGGNLSGGTIPRNLDNFEYYPKVKALRYRSAPAKRPLHKTRFR